jgi:hypothetical protein
MVHQMRERLPLNGHAQLVQVTEVRGAQPARLMHLGEEHFLGRPVLTGQTHSELKRFARRSIVWCELSMSSPQCSVT